MQPTCWSTPLTLDLGLGVLVVPAFLSLLFLSSLCCMDLLPGKRVHVWLGHGQNVSELIWVKTTSGRVPQLCQLYITRFYPTHVSTNYLSSSYIRLSLTWIILASTTTASVFSSKPTLLPFPMLFTISYTYLRFRLSTYYSIPTTLLGFLLYYSHLFSSFSLPMLYSVCTFSLLPY